MQQTREDGEVCEQEGLLFHFFNLLEWEEVWQPQAGWAAWKEDKFSVLSHFVGIWTYTGFDFPHTTGRCAKRRIYYESKVTVSKWGVWLSLLCRLEWILPSPVNPAFSLKLLTQPTSKFNFAANSTRAHTNWTNVKIAIPPGTGTSIRRLLGFELMRSSSEPWREIGGGRGSKYVSSTEERCLSCKSEGVLWRRPAV